MAILNWRDHPRLRFVDFPPPFLTKGSVFIASDGGDTAWISDGTTYLQLYPDAGTGIREYTWAARPAPGSPGRVIRVSDVGPAPGIEMVDSGTRWRPRGGSQVIAMRVLNPVTVQDLAGAVAETIGPFPGGLVRAGMQLEQHHRFYNAGIGAGVRSTQTRIGNDATRNTWNNSVASASGALLQGDQETYLDVVSDTLSNHLGGSAGGNPSHSASGGVYLPQVDFSQPWSMDIFMVSAAETAVNISSATWAGGIATFNTAAAHTLAVGDKTVIDSVTPTGYNGTFIVLSVPTSTQFTVALAANPGAYTSGGTSSRISNMVSQSYVLTLVG